jgi:two-component system sensor histidine kinase DesK
MLTASPVLQRGLLFECRAMSESTSRELAPVVTREFVRAFVIAAIGVNIALSLIDVWRIEFLKTAPPGGLAAAAIAAAIAIPLHIRHVLFGLRGERPPAGVWTLAALFIVNAVAFPFVGQGWTCQFASLVVSVLVFVPGAWAIVLAGAIVLSPLLLLGTDWYGVEPRIGGFYLVFAITWRAATQFVPLRLMAAIRALDAANGELGVRAVVQARVRIDAELRTGVARALESIIARGEAVRVTANADPKRVVVDLRRLTGESRTALADARRLVARYRGSSSRAEVNAVLREWEQEA